MKHASYFGSLSLVLLTVVAVSNGCSVTQLDADLSPGTQLSKVKKFYVVHLPEDGHDIDRLIAEQLNRMDRTATYGEKSGIPADVDAIVTYQDRWMWDITMYMIELNIQLRNPKTEIAIATGHSFRTSLGRKSPAGMVEEVLSEIFKKG